MRNWDVWRRQRFDSMKSASDRGRQLLASVRFGRCEALSDELLDDFVGREMLCKTLELLAVKTKVAGDVRCRPQVEEMLVEVAVSSLEKLVS